MTQEPLVCGLVSFCYPHRRGDVLHSHMRTILFVSFI